MRAATLSITIHRPLREVFDFVSNPANLPLWSPSFYLGITQEADQWVIQSPGGSVPMRMSADLESGIVDQYLMPAPEVELHIPARVVPNEAGAEFIFTLFQPSDIPDDVYHEEVKLVYRELEILKQLLENKAN